MTWRGNRFTVAQVERAFAAQGIPLKRRRSNLVGRVLLVGSAKKEPHLNVWVKVGRVRFNLVKSLDPAMTTQRGNVIAVSTPATRPKVTAALNRLP